MRKFFKRNARVEWIIGWSSLNKSAAIRLLSRWGILPMAGLLCVLAGSFMILPSSARAQENDPCRAVGPQAEQVEGMAGYTYRTASGRDLRIHVAAPSGDASSRPGVLFFFGGGWAIGNIQDFAQRARDFARQGYVAAVADYRVYCRDRTKPADALIDAKAAYAWFRDHAKELGVDKDRLVLSGGSAGGQLSLMTALEADAETRPVALVLYNPAVDLTGFGPRLGLSDEQARALSPMRQDLGRLPPTIIFHGQSDRSVPIQSVRDFCTAARRARRVCRVEEYAGQDHSFFHSQTDDPHIGRSPYQDTLSRSLDFLAELHIGDSAR